MERFPEEWLCEPLQGPFATPPTTTTTYIEVAARSYQTVYHCLLCGACQMTSELTLQEHVRGRRHQRLYHILQQQQRAWFLDQLVPTEFLREHQNNNNNNNNSNNNSAKETSNSNNDDGDPSLLSYIMPFRRWQHNNAWRAGMSCQLCGTAGMSTRLDVAHHCLTSQRHATYRSNTEILMMHHSECKGLKPRLEALLLPNNNKRYKWEFERHMIAYVGSKEAAFAGLESQAFEWYHLLHTLEIYELRAKLVFLELAIWKASMMMDDDDDDDDEDDDDNTKTRKSSSTFSSPSDSYREERRTTCGSTAILQNVFPYLQTLPRLENELGW
jgi:hypothetical protein